MTPQSLPNLIQVPELFLIGALVSFFAIWGWRHGLDAVILAGLFVLFGRFSVDTLALPAAGLINFAYGIVSLVLGGRFSTDTLIGVIKANPEVVKPLINVRDPNDVWVTVLGTGLFVLIAYLGFRFAVKKAGGKDKFLERVFGFVGGGALGYLCITFVIDRHIVFPQAIKIEPSTVPPITLNAPLLVAIVFVLIVFGLQRSKAPAKKK
jgi:hypothetical protein